MTEVLEQPQQQTTAIQKRANYNPLAPVGSGLKGLLETQKDGIAKMLPRHITPERLFKTLLVAANKNPDIFRCTQASVLECVNRAAELGVDLSGTLGEAYPVPFNNKVKYTDESGRTQEVYVMQLTLILGYRGFEKLAWQSGEVESIDAEVVCENDQFIFKKGTEVLVDFQPCIRGDRGNPIGAYACVKLKSGGKLARFLTATDIEKIRNSAKSKNSPAWVNWWDEMARKCALKRTLKDAPLSTEKFTKALELEDQDLDLSDVISVEPEPRRGSAALVDKLKGREPVKDPFGQNVDVPPPPASEEEAERILQEKSSSSQSSPSDSAAPSAGPRQPEASASETDSAQSAVPAESPATVPAGADAEWFAFQITKALGCSETEAYSHMKLRLKPWDKLKQKDRDAALASLRSGEWSK